MQRSTIAAQGLPRAHHKLSQGHKSKTVQWWCWGAAGVRQWCCIAFGQRHREREANGVSSQGALFRASQLQCSSTVMPLQQQKQGGNHTTPSCTAHALPAEAHVRHTPCAAYALHQAARMILGLQLCAAAAAAVSCCSGPRYWRGACALHIQTHAHAHTHALTPTHTHTCAHIRTHACMDMHLLTCIHVHPHGGPSTPSLH